MIRFITYLLGKPYETCKSCEVLKQQLEISNGEKRQLLDQLLDITKPKVVEQINVREIEPIRPKGIPWRVRQSKLEAESRMQARIKKEKDEELKRLEEEVMSNASEEREAI